MTKTEQPATSAAPATRTSTDVTADIAALDKERVQLNQRRLDEIARIAASWQVGSGYEPVDTFSWIPGVIDALGSRRSALTAELYAARKIEMIAELSVLLAESLKAASDRRTVKAESMRIEADAMRVIQEAQRRTALAQGNAERLQLDAESFLGMQENKAMTDGIASAGQLRAEIGGVVAAMLADYRAQINQVQGPTIYTA